MKRVAVFLAILFFVPLVLSGQIQQTSTNGWKVAGYSPGVKRAFSRIVKDTAVEGKYSQEFFLETQNQDDWVEWEKTFPTFQMDNTGYLSLFQFMHKTRDPFPNNTGTILYFSVGKNQMYYSLTPSFGIPGFIYLVWYGGASGNGSWLGMEGFEKVKFRMRTVETTLVSIFLDWIDLFVSPETRPIKLDRMGDDVVGVEDVNIPTNFKLFQNYPNPFNPETKIRFELESSKFVKFQVFDALGREVATLINEEKFPGEYEVKFNASHLPSGTYFYVLRAGNFSETKKMILMK